ncbi:glycosyltransferase [Dermabacteraceae bacterium P13147]
MSSPERIAMISLHTSPLAEPGRADAGGMNVVLKHTAQSLGELGVAVDMFTRRSDAHSPEVEQVSANVRLIRLPGGPTAPLPKSEMEQAIEPFGLALQEFYDGPGADALPSLIHSHHWFSGVAALPVAKRLGVPHVQSFHSVAAPAEETSLSGGEPAESPGRIAGERLSARESDLVVAVSEAERRTIHERYGVCPSRIRVVRPGVDVELFRPLAEGEARPAQPYLMFAARLQPLKGPDLALEVLARVRESFPKMRLVLAGEASDDFAEFPAQLRERAAELGLTDAVSWQNACAREQLAELMRGAAMFLAPSWSETFGLVALESQASGVPVAGWRCAGGLAEAIDSSGALLTTRDPDVWAHEICTLLGDPERYAQACVAAREAACRHTWEQSAARLSDVYASLAKTALPGDPWAYLTSRRSVMVVHAHPDDEALATAPLIAYLVSLGIEVSLVTATRGERGEVVPGAIAPGDERPLEQVRADELAASVKALGISQQYMLGGDDMIFRDSGMRWISDGVAGPALDVTEDALTARERCLAEAALADLIDRVSPGAVLSYDMAGTYGHPDHVRMHEVSRAACAQTGVACFEFASEENYVADADAPRVLPALPAGAQRSFAWRELPETAPQMLQALDAYRTQLTVLESFTASGLPVVRVRHVGGQVQDVVGRAGIRGQ